MFLGNNACSGLTHTMADTYRTRLHKNKYKYKVNTIPIKDVLKKNNITYIDFLV